MSRDYHRKNKISGQFSWRTIAMMESPAFQVLSLSGRRVLDRLEIEHAHHGGNDNGQLPVTYDQFIEYGIHRNAVSPAIREVEALGFVRSPNGARRQCRVATAEQIPAHLSTSRPIRNH